MRIGSRWVSLVAVLCAIAAPGIASAEWTRVTGVPSTTLYTVSVNGDTIATGADSVVYVSTDAGATWRGSATVVHNGLEVERVRVRNGRLYAGTRRKGMFVSDNLGATWSDFNQGLVGGWRVVRCSRCLSRWPATTFSPTSEPSARRSR
jgi:photosystem II stability/assembly factor-like uncharacterized protein